MRLFSCLALAMLALAAPTLAQFTPGQAAEPAVRLDAVENALRLSIRFVDYPQLSGDYRVNVDGTVSIPVVGRIPISGLGIADLERTLSQKVTEIVGQESSASVEVAEYRPIYVTGYVNRAGPMPWDPGMSVLQAIAVAGGPYRAVAVSGGERGAMTRLRRATNDQKRALARRARLQAEQAGADDIQIPDALITLVGPQEAAALIDAERPIMENRRASLRNQLTALEKARALASNELQALEDQKVRIAEQLNLRQTNREKIRTLITKGVAVAERGLEEDVKVSELQEKNANIAVALARIRGTAANLDRDAVTLVSNDKAEIGTSLQAVEKQIADNALDLQDALADSDPLGRTAAPDDAAALGYQITRRAAASPTSLDAVEDTLLAPGDVLVVSLKRRDVTPPAGPVQSD
jgi:exopolysaccharide production protein ExoF